jgi:hypothetical protein
LTTEAELRNSAEGKAATEAQARAAAEQHAAMVAQAREQRTNTRSSGKRSRSVGRYGLVRAKRTQSRRGPAHRPSRRLRKTS